MAIYVIVDDGFDERWAIIKHRQLYCYVCHECGSEPEKKLNRIKAITDARKYIRFSTWSAEAIVFYTWLSDGRRRVPKYRLLVNAIQCERLLVNAIQCERPHVIIANGAESSIICFNERFNAIGLDDVFSHGNI